MPLAKRWYIVEDLQQLLASAGALNPAYVTAALLNSHTETISATPYINDLSCGATSQGQ